MEGPLEYIWFCVFIVASIFLSRVYVQKDEDGDGIDAAGWLIGAFGSGVLALVVSWPKIGEVLFSWLKSAIPQAGTNIHLFTVYVLLGLVCMVVIFGVPLMATGSVAVKFLGKKCVQEAS